MAILTLTSNHPDFTQLIKKHPEGGLLIKTIRNGTSFGWYENKKTYCTYFQDHGTSLSFRGTREEQQHYLNVTQYSSPQAYLALITEFFKAAMKEKDQLESENQITITMIEIKKIGVLEAFQRLLTDFTMEAEELMEGFYRLTISTSSLYKILHGTYFLLLLLAKESSTFLDENDSLIQRGIQSIQGIQAPYYLRNLFVRKFLYSRQAFMKHKEEMEKYGQEQIVFAYRGTGFSRIEKVNELLDFKQPILDVGCGSGAYFRFADKIGDKPYIGVDIDAEVLDYAQTRGERMGLTNLQLLTSLDQVRVEEPVDILLMEVLEHMPKEEAGLFIQRLLSFPVNHLILTTPNKDFNRFYGMDQDQMRHEDHHFEMTATEFQQWLSSLVEDRFVIHFMETGDCVNGISTTQGAWIEKKETEG